jgi:hypothetical protein
VWDDRRPPGRGPTSPPLVCSMSNSMILVLQVAAHVRSGQPARMTGAALAWSARTEPSEDNRGAAGDSDPTGFFLGDGEPVDSLTGVENGHCGAAAQQSG